ncbi:tRNA uridine-5-carboxymethylaminomethyl(34) synthesis GTPase MnmE [Sediminicurvatus halobius]|uniref:tRNA modification GTPase MnmE n=1 Tax=Sediminicurvatus halobius TaxID=2182432 RepID=A0A2U2N2S6_9GAMM|nr:tRNA uridine-5-carboxymethylaminomethyl(34) synthesis GTPase MnmE [Spiribacter halobius]PWG63382.1 tRNA uridine-5-carboxymethylaminomethyl(34) synthesis GTPase MnmE [Spiribacter halobius]UEX78052.1 tRNA uridine-5-carboxymethylaminomethyl(34) synthesis GTPase MnmE [Spiribacter halobius]
MADGSGAAGGAETICAVATPPGQGGIGVVRLSGPAAAALAAAVAGPLPAPRYAALRRFRDAAGEAIDEGLVLYFPGPHSLTGEDVVELQGHGGPVVLDRLLQRLLALGARLARPGEFSERAFLNGRMDLSRAEAVADLIAARSEAAARAAMRSLQGELAGQVHALTDALAEERVQLEARIDFADEPLEGLSHDPLPDRLAALAERLAATRAAAGRGQLLREGLTVVIAGRPNAGKSSLLNRLAQRDAAIVTEIAGTTRDVIDEHLHIDGLPLRVLDTAGLRPAGDAVEREGVRRAQAAMAQADRLLLVVDDRDPAEAVARLRTELPARPTTLVRNKCDLSGHPAGPADEDGFRVSALTGAGMDELRAHLRSVMGADGEVGTFTARRRHLEALDTAGEALAEAQAAAEAGAGEELVAESLRMAQQRLGEITGEVTTEDLLGRIFASFCIGK